MLATVRFDVSASADVGTQTPLTLAVADLNEGSVPRALVDGSYSFFVMYGDVTGNGAVRPFDAGWILEFVAGRLIGETNPFPIEYETPIWSTDIVPPDVAWEVADVYKGDDPATVPPDTITAMDAVTILQHVVGSVGDLPFTPPAAAPPMLVTTHRIVGSSVSARPGGEIVVSLSATNLRAGELRLDFDPRTLRVKGVSAGSAASTGSPPLLRHAEQDGAVGVAVATSRPLTGSILDVAFETVPGIRKPVSGVIRASRVRLNGAAANADFEYVYHVEPYRTRLMANYPNPFNPETWIPFELSETSDVTIRIHDLAGNSVRTLALGRTPPGAYTEPDRAAHWDGTNDEGEPVASGMYLYELRAAGQRSLRRMVVLK